MFSPEGMYQACGMFTISHLVAFFLCVSLVIVLFAFTRNMSNKSLRHLVLFTAITLSVLEVIKILYKFIVCVPYNAENAHKYNLSDLSTYDTWIPLFFCSLFIYALWMSLAKNEHIRKLGESYIMCGAFGGGFAFLVLPTTSLQMVPIWHFESIHSLLFHCMMCYMSLLYLYRQFITRNSLINYVIFFYIFSLPSMIFNAFTGANLMMLSHSFIPFMPTINTFFNTYKVVYSLLCQLAYIVVPFSLSVAINHGIFHKHLQETIINADESTEKFSA